jgi:hypothetical protein
MQALEMLFLMYKHSYDILGARILWKPKKSIKSIKIRVEECYDKVLNEEFKEFYFTK